MAEEKTNEKSQEEVENSELTEVEALKKLKEENEKLKAQNKSLEEAKSKAYDKILNGGKIVDNEPKTRSSKEIRDEMQKTCTKNSNLRNWQLSYELDEAVRREEGQSSYVPKGVDENGQPFVPTQDELANAEAVHDTIKECLEEAGTDMSTLTGGDPALFNMALKKRRL